jgi:YbbR domain-containing protein
MSKWFSHNIWLKLIALVLAVITWFYVNGELVKGAF